MKTAIEAIEIILMLVGGFVISVSAFFLYAATYKPHWFEAEKKKFEEEKKSRAA
jgi:hypothetical protein